MDVVCWRSAGLGGGDAVAAAEAWDSYVKKRHVLRRGSTERKQQESVVRSQESAFGDEDFGEGRTRQARRGRLPEGEDALGVAAEEAGAGFGQGRIILEM